MIIEANRVYWCCLGSMESDNYSEWGRAAPVEPWQGRLEIVERPGGLVHFLRRFNEETGKVDFDPNASALVTKPEEQLFETFEEANQTYIQEQCSQVLKLAHHLEDAVDKVFDATYCHATKLMELEHRMRIFEDTKKDYYYNKSTGKWHWHDRGARPEIGETEPHDSFIAMIWDATEPYYERGA